MSKALICHISTTFNIRSGFAKRTLKIMNACVENGYDVLLVVGKDNDVGHHEIAGVTIEIISELEKYISINKDIAAYKGIKKVLDKHNPDIIHTHLAKAGILGRLTARKGRGQVIHTVHGPTFPKTLSTMKRSVYWFLEWYVARYTDVFIFVGEEIKNDYIEAKVSNAGNSRVIYTARDDSQINYDLLDKESRESLRSELISNSSINKKIISYIGRLVPSKQQDHAIRVLGKLHEKGHMDAHLVLVGKALLDSEVEYERKLVQLAKELGLDDFVHFVGHRNDALEIMDASDTVILPSKYEGLPNVVVESVLAGTPVVSYDVSGVKELLLELCETLVVKQGNIDEMAERISHVFETSEDFIHEYSLLRDKFKSNFSRSVMLENKLSLYRDVLNP